MLEGGEMYGGEGPETMTAEDAYKFPIVGSFTLGGLYLCFKYFDKETINKILGAYFLLICTGVVFTSMEPLFGYFINGNKTTIDYVKIATRQKEMQKTLGKK